MGDLVLVGVPRLRELYYAVPSFAIEHADDDVGIAPGGDVLVGALPDDPHLVVVLGHLGAVLPGRVRLGRQGVLLDPVGYGEALHVNVGLGDGGLAGQLDVELAGASPVELEVYRASAVGEAVLQTQGAALVGVEGPVDASVVTDVQ